MKCKFSSKLLYSADLALVFFSLFFFFFWGGGGGGGFLFLWLFSQFSFLMNC